MKRTKLRNNCLRNRNEENKANYSKQKSYVLNFFEKVKENIIEILV